MVIHPYILLTEKNIYFFIFFSRFYHFYPLNSPGDHPCAVTDSMIKIHPGLNNFNVK